MNILAIGNYIIDPEKHDTFQKMSDISRGSYERWLLGEWKYIGLGGDFSVFLDGDKMGETSNAFNAVQRDIFYRLYGLWKTGHNVLYVTPDTLCVKPTTVFGLTKEFSMFWNSNPSKFGAYDPYFNSGIIYIPKETKKEVWDVGFKNIDRLNNPDWNASQELYNEMLYSQGGNVKRFLHNELHWSEHTKNEIERDDAHIIHYHGSKGLDEVKDKMVEDAVTTQTWS